MALSEMITPLLGGGLIGLSAILLMLFNGRIAGISGIVRGALTLRGSSSWQLFFLAGLVLSGVAAQWLLSPSFSVEAEPLPLIILAGFLVGAGTCLGDGCTSGHGRFALRVAALCSFWVAFLKVVPL